MEIRHIVVRQYGDLFIFKVGAHKSVDRDNEEFQKERVDSWPNVTVIIQNAPDAQVIAISKNQKAFSSTGSVAKLFEKTVTPPLRNYGLSIQVKEQFEKKNFWTVVSRYRGRLSRIRFEMVAPNMANISSTLKVDLRRLNRESNCQKTNLELEATKGASLEINETNELIDSCVEYASLGGGDIAIKIKGIKKEVRTSSTVKTVEVDELLLEGASTNIVGVLEQLLKA